MGIGRTALSIVLAGSLAGCGGGGNNSGGGGGPIGGTPTPTPPPSSSCSLSARQDFVRAVLNEWYLFPDLLDTSVNQANFNDVQSYIDALVAPARAQSKDRFFTYITSIAEEEAFAETGSSAGFGIRLGYDTGANRVFVIEAFEEGPGLSQGLDRGVELLSVGPTASSLQTIAALMASGGPQAVINALGPSDPGLQRVFRIRELGGAERQITVTKAEYELDPVSDRYGAKIIDDGGKKVGYLNLRTFFVESADPELREAFETFRQQGVTELIVDFRYNGGGFINIADLMGDLMGRAYELDPVSDRYGAKIIDDGGKKVGYLNLRTFFVESADPELREAFETFRQQGVTELIVDFRYNGGGFINIADLMGDLMGRAYVGQVFSQITYRPSKSDFNETLPFNSQAQAIAPTKIAFIATGGTASASELVTNAFIPYLDTNMALVGTNTFGKPVGQGAFDNAECDDRLRAVVLKTDNADGQGDYFNGLAGVVPVTCRASDDIFTQLGDPNEASVAQALAFLRGGPSVCTPISSSSATAAVRDRTAMPISSRRELLQPSNPTPAQREVPGLF